VTSAGGIRGFLVGLGLKGIVKSPPLKRMVSPNQDHYRVLLPKY
jgi:hypothetical protein